MAGAYLSQSADSFNDYLQLYNNSWNDLSRYSSGPVDYEDRTMYSMWNVPYKQIRGQDPAAAELLKLMAYLDNQNLWYELFHGSIGDAPAWWVDVLKSRARFNRAISTLHNYFLLEVGEGRYRLHTCVHDWTLEYLNYKFDGERCWESLTSKFTNLPTATRSNNTKCKTGALPSEPGLGRVWGCLGRSVCLRIVGQNCKQTRSHTA